MTQNLFPSLYSPDKADQDFVPDLPAAIAAGRLANLGAALRTPHQVMLLIVDPQNDFVSPAGSLCVPGAVADMRRLTEFIYRNAAALTNVAVSLDTHIPYQIFFSTWWQDAAGHPPDPFTTITLADVRAGQWRPLIDPRGSLRYLEQLEAGGKKKLMIWPFHTMAGTWGHNVTPLLMEAINWLAAARSLQPLYLIKGMIPATEFYSILEPEVHIGSHPQGGLNAAPLELAEKHDLVYIAGEARSHCVLETMESIVRHFATQPDVLAKFRFLMDCTASIPGFEADTDRRLQEMARLGIKLVNSSDPIA